MKHRATTRCLFSIQWMGVFILSLSVSVALAADPAGEIILMKGVATAQLPGDAARTLDKGSSVFEREKITTAAESYVVIRMADGGKLTLRPGTELVIDAFSQRPRQEAETLHLLKGGLRKVSGAIGKLRPEGVLLKTPSASIGIRGTNYVARLCQQDCGKEEKALAQFSRRSPGPDASGLSAPDLTAVCQGQSRPVAREPVGKIKHALYFAVFEGGITAALNCDKIDLDAVDACYSTKDAIRCLEEIPRFLMYDSYLGDDKADGKLVIFNLFHTLGDDDSACELPAN